ncbi:unnamed protein product [Rhizophagus irregularis]|nr:unnamed protein product [Rhizophagus irregularis]
MFSNFGEQKLERVDSSTSSKKIAEWKKSAKLQEVYRELFENQGILTKITSSVFKSYEGSELPPEYWQSIKNKVTVTSRLLQELVAKEDSEQSPEISSIIEKSSDADDGNSSSYEELLKSLDLKFS